MLCKSRPTLYLDWLTSVFIYPLFLLTQELSEVQKIAALRQTRYAQPWKVIQRATATTTTKK